MAVSADLSSARRLTIPAISILIVNYNGLKHLPECLASIYGQSFRDFEVVLVDNDSRDGSREYLRVNFPQVRLVESDRNRGFAGGNNFGIPHCLGESIFFLNNDTRLDPDALAELIRAAERHPEIRVFASFLLNYREPHLADSAGDTLYDNGVPFGFSRYPAEMFSRPRQTTAACAGAALYSRKVLDKIGFFDEDFFLIFEDLDLSFRARHAGEKILFVPTSKVYHKGSASMGGATSPLSLYYCERNIWPFLIKNVPSSVLLGMLPHLLVLKLMRLWVAIRCKAVSGYFKATWSSLGLFPKMFARRREILGTSVLDSREFRKLLRRGWLRERLAFKRGDYHIPVQGPIAEGP